MQTINERVWDLMEKTRTNFVVEKHRFQGPEGYEAPNAYGIYARHLVADKKPTYLGTVRGQYSVLQNSEMAEIFLLAAQDLKLDISETRGGSLANYKKVYYQIELEDHHIRTGSETNPQDTVHRMLTAMNGHDGGMSVGFGTTNEVVICENTFYAAFKTVRKIRHSGDVAERVGAVAENLVAAINEEEAIMKTYDRFASEKMTQGMVKDLIKAIFEVDPDDKLQDISTRKRNQLTDFSRTIQSETKSHGATVWGLFNAVTYFTNHVIRPSKTPVLDYVMDDRRGATINSIGFNVLKRQMQTASN